MYLNRVIILGNLTRDPELRYLPATGVPVAAFDVATNRAWTDASGDRQESVEFHHVIVYGNQAEPSAEYLRRGQLVLVEGRLQTRSWDGQDGQKRYRTEIIAERVQFGPRRQDAAHADDAAEENVPLDGNDVVPF
jgi:single-strand DNA-binding protein